ncbi:MAG: transposase [Candidatus Marinimicrobia bacterium]|nr:transposase [Candidatus Neomarinimicrobiota bacterium]
MARDLGIEVETLRRWKREYQTKNRQAFVGSGHMSDPAQSELKVAKKRAKDMMNYKKQGGGKAA